MDDYTEIIGEFAKEIKDYYKNEETRKPWYPMFYRGTLDEHKKNKWVKQNYEKFLKDTKNAILYNRWYCSELGAITALAYAPDGSHIVTGHSSGMIQMRHGSTGTVLYTLRNIQFPPKPVYALEYSRVEERICYAACMDGAVYRIEIPNLCTSTDDPPEFCIRADPALESMNTQFYGTPGISSCSTPFITQRSPALSLGVTADETKIIVGYGDSAIRVYDVETQEGTSLLFIAYPLVWDTPHVEKFFQKYYGFSKTTFGIKGPFAEYLEFKVLILIKVKYPQPLLAKRLELDK